MDGHFMDAGSPSRCILISAAPTHLAQGLALAVLGADIAEALRVGDVHLGLVRGALLGLLPQVAEVLVTWRTGRGRSLLGLLSEAADIPMAEVRSVPGLLSGQDSRNIRGLQCRGQITSGSSIPCWLKYP